MVETEAERMRIREVRRLARREGRRRGRTGQRACATKARGEGRRGGNGASAR